MNALDCLHTLLFRRRSKKALKLRATGLCEGNSPVTSEFPSQMASQMEDIDIAKTMLLNAPGPLLNNNTIFPMYRDPHVKEKTAARTSNF